MAIQMRRGLNRDFDPAKMLPGEWAVAIDRDTAKQMIWMCFAPGVTKRMGTYEDFRRQIEEAVDEIKEKYLAEFSIILDEIKVLSDQTSQNTDTVIYIRDEIENTYFPQILENAQISIRKAEEALDFSELSKSYARGTGNTVRPADETDNARFYSELAQRLTAEAQELLEQAQEITAGDVISSLRKVLEDHKASGDHDGRYYTEAEIDTMLAGKSATGHVHDDRYYTEAEVNTMLAGKLPTTASCNKNWHWSGQAGQPTGLWGGNDGTNMYVYNPANFNVSHAGTAHGLRTYSQAGGTHGGNWILKVHHNHFAANNMFGLYVDGGSSGQLGVHVSQAINSQSSENASFANVAAHIGRSGNTNNPMTFRWSGQAGQPNWVWGGNDGDPNNMYVYNPANFSVSHADTASNVYAYITSHLNLTRHRCRIVLTSEGNFRPDSMTDENGNVLSNIDVSGGFNLGVSSKRWKQLYAATATISTSDRNLKKDIKPLSDQYLKFFMRLQPVSFLFRDGESGRTHTGFIAQDVEEAMAECGLTDLDFAGFCKDVKQKESRIEKIREVKDEDGKTREDEYEETVYEDVMNENGNPEYIYSLRYEEFIALNTHMIQTVVNRMEEMDQRMADLENRMERFEKLMKA